MAGSITATKEPTPPKWAEKAGVKLEVSGKLAFDFEANKFSGTITLTISRSYCIGVGIAGWFKAEGSVALRIGMDGTGCGNVAAIGGVSVAGGASGPICKCDSRGEPEAATLRDLRELHAHEVEHHGRVLTGHERAAHFRKNRKLFWNDIVSVAKSVGNAVSVAAGAIGDGVAAAVNVVTNFINDAACSELGSVQGKVELTVEMSDLCGGRSPDLGVFFSFEVAVKVIGLEFIFAFDPIHIIKPDGAGQVPSIQDWHLA
jgi:hypothetical protein